MFYLSLTVVFVLIYWLSSLVAELILTSRALRQLPIPLRTALGYLLVSVWFAASFKLLPIHWGWVIGLLLLAAYTISRSQPDLMRHLADASRIAKSHMKPFGWYLLLANIFLLPLHLAATYGPFTEGGGDVSIYADVTKYLTDHHLPAFGLDDAIFDYSWLIKEPLRISTDNTESLAKFDETIGNPPTADYQAYRVVNVQKHGSALFSPTAQWAFLSGTTNLPIFYANQAFQYAALIYCVFLAFFGRFGRWPAIAAAVVVVASHGLISVFYNVYFVQGMSLMICAVVINLIFAVKSKGSGVFKVFGLCVLLVGVLYLHYISVLLPFVVVPILFALISRRMTRSPDHPTEEPDSREAELTIPNFSDRLRGLLRIVSIGTTTCFVSFWTVIELTIQLKFIIPLVKIFLGWLGTSLNVAVQYRHGVDEFFGVRESIFSIEWLTFFFGALSQQHFEPLVHVYPIITWILPWCVYSGLTVLLISFALSTGLLGPVITGRLTDSSNRQLVVFSTIVYFFSLFVVFVHHFLAQSSLYTQAKGAQNVLVVLYVCMLLPFALAYKLYQDGYRRRWLKIVGLVSSVALAVFSIGLIVPRIVYTLMIAFGLGRSSILEPSYFSRAEEILRQDKEAFVLVEPRISADAYLGIQPFAGARMVPTRYLALSVLHNRYIEGKWIEFTQRNVVGSDVIVSEDLGHLWSLAAKRVGTRGFGEGFEGGNYEWEKERLAEVKEPRLLLFGYDYEAFYGERPRSSRSDDKGWFTFFRNGSAMIVMPTNSKVRSIEAKVQPRDGAYFGVMVRELTRWLEKAGGGWNARSDTSESFLNIRYEVPSKAEAQLVPLVRYEGEFWMNVRIDGAELKPPADTPALQKAAKIELKGTIEVFPEEVKVGGQVIGEWKGVEPANAEDWVGVFPVGGDDASRVVFAFTGGEKDGSAQLNLPATVKPGQYELRLYSKGSWQKMASSQPFTIAK